MHATYVGHRTDPAAMRWLFHDRSGPTGRLLDNYSLLVLNRARILVGVRSGRLISSLDRDFGAGVLGPYAEVTAGVPGITTYLGYHHDGTPAHTIRARRRKTLRFVSGGRVVYARQVRHPGTKGTHFLTHALDAIR